VLRRVKSLALHKVKIECAALLPALFAPHSQRALSELQLGLVHLANGTVVQAADQIPKESIGLMSLTVRCTVTAFLHDRCGNPHDLHVYVAGGH
jgi:hypothetical protein